MINDKFIIKNGAVIESLETGTTVLDVQGINGQLFSITDNLTGDIFAVSDITGIPILNVNSSGKVDVDGSLYINGLQTYGSNSGDQDLSGLLTKSEAVSTYSPIHIHPYLPLAGGTITGSTYNMLELKRTSAAGSSILFSNTSVNLGKFGFDSSGTLHLGNGSSTDGIGNLMQINSSGAVTFYSAVTAPTFSGSLSGNASSATYASTVTLTVDNSTNATNYPLFVNAVTGNLSPRTDTGFSYNPSTNTLSATTFVGNLTGTASGNLVSGGALGTPSSGNLSNCTFPTLNQSTTGNAATVTITNDESTNASDYVLFSSASSGSQSPRTDSTLRYNPSTNTLSATTFVGNLTGNATTASSTSALTRRGDNRASFNPSNVPASSFVVTFSTQSGLASQSDNSDYSDVMAINTYQDSSAGSVNALSFDKSGYRINHFMGSFNATGWAGYKTIAYTDGFGASGTWPISITGDASSVDGYNSSDFVKKTGDSMNGMLNITSGGFHVTGVTTGETIMSTSTGEVVLRGKNTGDQDLSALLTKAEASSTYSPIHSHPYAPTVHNHGNLLSDGTITASTAIANNFSLVVTNASNAVIKPTITFDGSTTSKALSQKGTWESFLYSGGALGTPSSGTLTNCTFPTLNQNTTGNAGTVTVGADNSTNATYYPLFATAVSGSLSPKTDNGYTYNPSTGNLSTSLINSIVINSYKGTNSDGYNVFVGNGGQSSSGEAAFTYEGSYNVSLGIDAFKNNTLGYRNIAIGYQSLYTNTTSKENIAIGNKSLYTANGSSCYSNIGIGIEALYSNVGENNVAIGYNTIYGNTSGIRNVGVGSYSLMSNSTGHYNSSFGYSSLSYVTSGMKNVAFGVEAGKTYTGSNNLTASTGSTFLGAYTVAKTNNSINETVIGCEAIGNGSNTVTIGNSSVTDTYIKGKLHVSDSGVISGITNSIEYAGITTYLTNGGYAKLPSGAIMQYGYYTGPSSTGDAYFRLPIDFPNGVVSANVTVEDSSASESQAVSIVSVNTYVVEIMIQTNLTYKSFHIVAFGY